MNIRKFFFISLFVLGASSAFTEEITGFWKSINEKTHQPESVVAIYEYKNLYYGRIVATYDKKGKITETIEDPKQRAPGVIGNPYYCGLDFIWGLSKKKDRYHGKIMDPEKGKIYRAVLWAENGDLIVRGELFIFGRNQTWLPFRDSEFTSYFKKPDVSKFVPVSTRVK